MIDEEVIERYTYEDYIKWKGDWEMIEGIPLAMSPAPIKKHQSLSAKIVHLLLSEIEECEKCEVYSEVDYKLSSNTVLRPDVVLSCNDNISESYLVKAPEIVFEVISLSTAKRDEIFKFKLYEKEKVKYYCLVYPNDCTVKIYILKDDKFRLEGIFSKESYRFESAKCSPEIDFKRVFKRICK